MLVCRQTNGCIGNGVNMYKEAYKKISERAGNLRAAFLTKTRPVIDKINSTAPGRAFTRVCSNVGNFVYYFALAVMQLIYTILHSVGTLLVGIASTLFMVLAVGAPVTLVATYHALKNGIYDSGKSFVTAFKSLLGFSQAETTTVTVTQDNTLRITQEQLLMQAELDRQAISKELNNEMRTIGSGLQDIWKVQGSASLAELPFAERDQIKEKLWNIAVAGEKFCSLLFRAAPPPNAAPLLAPPPQQDNTSRATITEI